MSSNPSGDCSADLVVELFPARYPDLRCACGERIEQDEPVGLIDQEVCCAWCVRANQ